MNKRRHVMRDLTAMPKAHRLADEGASPGHSSCARFQRHSHPLVETFPEAGASSLTNPDPQSPTTTIPGLIEGTVHHDGRPRRTGNATPPVASTSMPPPPAAAATADVEIDVAQVVGFEPSRLAKQPSICAMGRRTMWRTTKGVLSASLKCIATHLTLYQPPDQHSAQATLTSPPRKTAALAVPLQLLWS